MAELIQIRKDESQLSGLAAELNKKAAELNRLLSVAAEADLLVGVGIDELHVMGQKHHTPVLDVKIYKEL